MARTSGFKITKQLHDFARVSQITFTPEFTEADWIAEARDICHKHLPKGQIVSDLNEIADLESSADTQELTSEIMTDASAIAADGADGTAPEQGTGTDE